MTSDPSTDPTELSAGAEPVRPVTARERLDHLDSARPVQQVGVVTTHSLLYFAPAASSVAGATVLLTHFSREAFLCMSALVATYAYRDLAGGQVLHFWQRRIRSIGLPYLCWTAIYFAVTLIIYPHPAGGPLAYLWLLASSGYYQLYFLVVLAQFYLLFPLFLRVLGATRNHHWCLLAASFLLQLVLTGMVHWNLAGLGWLESYWGMRLLVGYQLYVVAGGLAGYHYRSVDAWVRQHAWAIGTALVVSAAAAEGWYVLACDHIVSAGLSASDDFQPAVVPFFISAVGAMYLAGLKATTVGGGIRMKRLVARCSDNAFGIYLSQMLFILGLSQLDWSGLNRVVPWPLVAAGSIVITFTGGYLLSEILSHTPLSVALTGRARRRRTTAHAPSGGAVSLAS